MSLLIKNAQLVSGEITNIFIKNELIYNISHKTPLADQLIDAKGNIIMPGIIDPHVHFRAPGAEHKEDWETGSKAAAAGGITTVLDMPNNNPSITSVDLLEKKRQLVRGRSYVNYGFYLGATESNLEELRSAQKIAGVKIYLGSTTGDLLVTDYNVMRRVLESSDCLVAVHAEDEECLIETQNLKFTHRIGGQNYNSKLKTSEFLSGTEFHALMRPEICAERAVEKVLKIVEEVKKPVYFCHVSGQQELEVLRQAKGQKLPIYIEATPHHLFLNRKIAAKLDNFAKVNPPLRSLKSQQALLKALGQGLIDAVATDHAPHTIQEKLLDYEKAPAGLTGLETSLALMLNLYYQGKIKLDKIVELMCRKPAKIFNIKNRGNIEPGFFADLLIVDLHLTKQVENSKLYTKCGWSPFAGRRLRGWPIITLVNGQVVFQKNKIIDRHAGREVF